MRKMMVKVVALGMMLMCGMPLQAQGLGDLLNGALGSTSKESTGSDNPLIQGLTTVFSSKKQATTENLVGTWVYLEPAIVFTSNNIMTQTASKVAANKIEKELQTQLDKYGIKKGMLTIEFKNDGTFSSTVKGKSTSGKWTVKDAKLQLTIAGKAIAITTQLSGKKLQIVTDATKLLDLFKTIGGAAGGSLGTVTSLMKSVDGMQAGLTLQKQ